jgi:hypothetical protein
MRFLRHALKRLMSNLRAPRIPLFPTTCPTRYFLGGDGSLRSAKGSAALALDPAWQSASIESFTDVTDDVMISLLLDTERAQAQDYVSDDQRAWELAVYKQLSIDGYFAGRILLGTSNQLLSWPLHPMSEHWRQTVLAHRAHVYSPQIRSIGAQMHVARVVAQAGHAGSRSQVTRGLSVLRSAFGDAVTEGILADPNWTQLPPSST